MAAELQAQAARLLVTSIASPATAPACQVAATVITTTFNTLLSTIDLAATTTAASLGTAASAGPGDGKNGGAAAAADSREKEKKRLLHLARKMMMALFGLAPFSEEDIEAYSQHPSKVLRPAQMPASASPVNKPHCSVARAGRRQRLLGPRRQSEGYW